MFKDYIIHVPKKDLVLPIMKIFDKMGYKWSAGDESLVTACNRWDSYGAGTCYRFDEFGKTYHGPRSLYMNVYSYIEIIDAKTFIDTHMKKHVTTVEFIVEGYRDACPDWKQKLRIVFSKILNKKFELGEIIKDNQYGKSYIVAALGSGKFGLINLTTGTLHECTGTLHSGSIESIPLTVLLDINIKNFVNLNEKVEVDEDLILQAHKAANPVWKNKLEEAFPILFHPVGFTKVGDKFRHIYSNQIYVVAHVGFDEFAMINVDTGFPYRSRIRHEGGYHQIPIELVTSKSGREFFVKID